LGFFGVLGVVPRRGSEEGGRFVRSFVCLGEFMGVLPCKCVWGNFWGLPCKCVWGDLRCAKDELFGRVTT
jgi:hypothetical protein